MVNSTTEWLGLIALAITTAGLVWARVVKPVRAAWRVFKAWMVRVDEGLTLVEEQMKPNHGSTLWDKSEQASIERKAMAADIAEIKGHVAMLLEHDRDRDQPGFRYGREGEDK